MQGQLSVGADRAAEVARLLAVLRTTFDRIRAATGALPVEADWSGTLQLAVALLGVVMPKDFGRFK